MLLIIKYYLLYYTRLFQGKLLTLFVGVVFLDGLLEDQEALRLFALSLHHQDQDMQKLEVVGDVFV